MLTQIYPQTSHPYAFELNKDMQVSAAHFIPREDAGACSRVHGHTYTINITIAGDHLNESGFLANFSTIKKLIHGEYDHTLLNDHKEFSGESREQIPSTEAVAKAIFDKVEAYLEGLENRPHCVQVFVRETPTSYVVYRPKQGDHHG
ncbi:MULTISPECIES: 6-carboxytetrahydropterin synthase QueD [Bacillus]|uniref:6-carboxy-5,6,7,8-tetrahydropterin synthase n=1 Tax=Bacillus glycinifermentans TaxID=1664069 RepID=A0AAJ3YWY9_9BACI|nr:MULTISPECIES: 6-carboxytetrahydropterin synthase QueD [Bacillus]KKB72271.1 6-carboxy-5,6,7,8-tetrahydropterin synthase [Bacillus sp. TH008]MDU0073316.1 6-carboxytetrahydropterin synthase QueD [Bacillus sp. IG6]MED8021116.1 6-carboxytetrahydropterin synthase QueD [Bacillus glycinifermentans]QAT64870.1 6-carboxytetrahydropterin synthase QueD [Bacillus glycinifermentans]WKB78742.1 6-carboxytetrahydropterin synthase QueD [Bacillus glycinifermentans]